MSFSVRWFQPGDEIEIVDLLNMVFEGWPKFDLNCSALDHWLWKYGKNLNHNNVSVAESQGKIIGCLHVVKTRIKFGETTVFGEQGSDAAVHPDFRGKGVYNAMDDMFSDLTLAYSLSGNPIVYKKAMRRGATFFPKPISYLLNIEDIDKHLTLNESEQAFIKKYGFKTLKFFYQTRKQSQAIDDDIHISQTEKFGEEIDILWENIRNKYDFIITRDSEYLNWRYIDPRSGNYKLFYAFKGSKFLGYMVLKINYYNKEYPIGTIVDMISLDNDNDILSKMYNYAQSYFRDNQINCVQMFSVKDTPINIVALNHGFIPAPNSYRMFFSRNNKIKTELLNETHVKRLHFTLGDTDII